MFSANLIALRSSSTGIISLMVSKNWHVGGDFINARFSSFKRGVALLQRRAKEVLCKRGDRRDWTPPLYPAFGEIAGRLS